MLQFADLIDKDELAALESWNSGKPYEQSAKSELPSFTRLFRYYAGEISGNFDLFCCLHGFLIPISFNYPGWANKIHGLTIPADSNHYVQTLHESIGVARQIIPWNFPLIMLAWKVGPALTCGNTIVLKSTEQTPLTALHVAKLFQEVWLVRNGYMINIWYKNLNRIIMTYANSKAMRAMNLRGNIEVHTNITSSRSIQLKYEMV